MFATTPRVALAVLLSAFVLVGGCSKTASTPKEALTKMVKAVANNDKSGFKAVTYFGEGNESFADTMFVALVTMANMQKSIAEIQTAEAKGATGVGMLPTDEELVGTEVNEAGDRATAKSKDRQMQLIRRDGLWYVDLSSAAPAAVLDKSKQTSPPTTSKQVSPGATPKATTATPGRKTKKTGSG